MLGLQAVRANSPSSARTFRGTYTVKSERFVNGFNAAVEYGPQSFEHNKAQRSIEPMPKTRKLERLDPMALIT